ncbi:unnamed protein product [Closterium sp. Naga37s-1]|nr:unnamed protein product [Closterium sp. Naga37s-1]
MLISFSHTTHRCPQATSYQAATASSDHRGDVQALLKQASGARPLHVSAVLLDHRGDVAAFTKRVQALRVLLEGVHAHQSGWSIWNGDLRSFVREEVASQVRLRYSDFLDRHRCVQGHSPC